MGSEGGRKGPTPQSRLSCCGPSASLCRPLNPLSDSLARVRVGRVASLYGVRGSRMRWTRELCDMRILGQPPDPAVSGCTGWSLVVFLYTAQRISLSSWSLGMTSVCLGRLLLFKKVNPPGSETELRRRSRVATGEDRTAGIRGWGIEAWCSCVAKVKRLGGTRHY